MKTHFQFDVGVVTVVGHSFWDPTIVQWDNDKAVDKCDFVIGEVNRLKDFHEPQMVNGIVCYIKVGSVFQLFIIS